MYPMSLCLAHLFTHKYNVNRLLSNIYLYLSGNKTLKMEAFWLVNTSAFIFGSVDYKLLNICEIMLNPENSHRQNGSN